jgi:hypothetical protein
MLLQRGKNIHKIIDYLEDELHIPTQIAIKAAYLAKYSEMKVSKEEKKALIEAAVKKEM